MTYKIVDIALGVLSLFMWGRSSFVGKGGGAVFFLVGKGGDQYFFTHAKGGPEKIDDRPSQIDGPPLPLKNDNSLMSTSPDSPSRVLFFVTPQKNFHLWLQNKMINQYHFNLTKY